jgi:hypothetical protein
MKEGRKGADAKELYEYLQYKARVSTENPIEFNDSEAMRDLGFGEKRLRYAKAKLKKMGLIGYIQERRTDGTYEARYIEIYTNPREPGDEPDLDISRGQRVKVKDPNDDYIDILHYWNKKRIKVHSVDVFKMRFEKRHRDTIDVYGTDAVKDAIDRYVIILNSDAYFFKYKWSLWDFIARGVEKFNDDSCFKNFKTDKTDKPQKTVAEVYGRSTL